MRVNIKLVHVDAAPTQQPNVPIVAIGSVVSFEGRLVDPSTAEFEGVDELAVLVDEKVPWKTVVETGAAAQRGRIKRLRFVFIGASALQQPPPSWISPELDELAKPPDPSKPAPRLDRERPPGKRVLFQNCPAARDLMSHLEQRAEETKREKAEVLMTELPQRVAQCGCAEDINAIERWLWAMWGRDDAFMPHAAIVVELDASAPKIEVNASTAWSEAYKALPPRAAF